MAVNEAVKARAIKYVATGACLVLLYFFVYGGGERSTLFDDVLVRESGPPGTKQFRYYLWYEARKISPWHSLPLHAPEAEAYYTFVNEVPKGARAKFEINKEAVLNPIIQDVKKGKLRHYHEPSLVNYGALPQTWEDPNQRDEASGLVGDNDPLDVLEIGEQVARVGEVYPVKVLGALGMMDGGGDGEEFEMDWKIIAVRATDPLAAVLNDLSQADDALLARIEALMVWFRDYKIPDGKPPNKFTNGGKPYPRGVAVQVIGDTHEHWKRLVDRKTPNKDNFWLP